MKLFALNQRGYNSQRIYEAYKLVEKTIMFLTTDCSNLDSFTISLTIPKNVRDLVSLYHMNNIDTLHPILDHLGYINRSGTWVGITGQVAKQEADVAFVPIGITYDRFSAMHFTPAFSFYQITFFIKGPGKFSDWNAITKPFSMEIWIALFTSAFIFGLFLHLILQKDFISAKNRECWTLRQIFWNLFSTCCGQGLGIEKLKGLASRIMIGIWWLSIVVLITGYSGALMSFMTCPLTESYPRDFEELANFVRNGKYSCGTFEGLASWKYMLESESENTKILKEHILSNNNLMTVPQAMNKMQNERFAFIMSTYVLNQFISKVERHKYIISTDSLHTYIIAYPIRKGFPFKNDISKTVIRLFEAGIAEKLLPLQVEEFQEPSEFQPLSVEDIKSPLLLMVIGYLLCIVGLTMEIIYDKVTKTLTHDNLH
ncbi:probable glutamate receptor [Centruroides sculpturatus]|uniref:probable glutamate receptor n=1 Tax=Centruroides sculpturatus TaxID=218467 RepID=UPI000C6EF486|nr:probable glutamate receptor [Centruroides sculpturatus]